MIENLKKVVQNCLDDYAKKVDIIEKKITQIPTKKGKVYNALISELEKYNLVIQEIHRVYSIVNEANYQYSIF